MADENNQEEGSTGTAAAAPIVLSADPIDITHQYIKDLSFENPLSPRFLVEADATPQISIQVNANAAPMGDRRYEVNLFLNARAEHDGQIVFLAELQYGAHVVIGDVAEEHVQPLLFIEVPRMLFPFARQILSNVVRDGGFPPLFMNPVDFMEMYSQGIEIAGADEDEEEAEGGASKD
ncbi:MAG: protein-export chaperone SecB [Proteobacteria bacterium]|nr:protein-export chaperone SecB [Pseudomonadota bacterium]